MRSLAAPAALAALAVVAGLSGEGGIDRLAEMAEMAASHGFAMVAVDAGASGADTKALGDLNGDGFLDIVVADDESVGLQWYEYPTWTLHVIDTRRVFTTDMQTADVDGDGDTDVVVPDYVTKRILWFANPGPGGEVWTEVTIGAGEAHDLRLGDLDGDGRVDVIARAPDGPTVAFFQNGPRSWSAVRLVNAPDGEGVALGDLDGDGDLDIVGSGYWLESPAEPRRTTWARHVIDGSWPARVSASVGDLDGDGRLDVVLGCSESTGRLAWYAPPAHPAAGRWTMHEVDPSLDYAHGTHVVDMDGDGRLDIAFAEMHQSRHDRVGFFRNTGGGAAFERVVLSTGGSHNIQAGDVGADGDIDLVGANWEERGPLWLWENQRADQPDAAWRRTVVDARLPYTAVFVIPADIDGDGRSDIVAGGWWYRNPGDPALVWERLEIGEPLANAAVVYDYTGDGAPDVLGTQGGRGLDAEGRLAWAVNDGTGAFRVLTNLGRANGDFLQGATVARLAPGAPLTTILSWHSGGGIQALTTPDDPIGELWEWRRLSPVSQSNGIAVADVDGDRDADVVLGTTWLRNDTAAAWTPFTLNPVAGDPDRVTLVDLSGDGRLDAVVGFEVISAPGKLAWYEQPPDSTATWTEHVIAYPVGPMSVDVADLDGDGDLDVVVGEHDLEHPADARLVALLNQGDQGRSWLPWTLAVGDEHHDGAQVVDIDGDGDLDVVSIGWGHSNVLLYENRAGEEDLR